MRTLIPTLPLATIISVWGAAPTPWAAEDPSHNAWQHNLLFAPTAGQIEIEKRGRVVIFDGLRDIDVDRAMDQQFHRVQSMMFVRTIVTDEEGTPEADPETGVLIIEDDGCD